MKVSWLPEDLLSGLGPQRLGRCGLCHSPGSDEASREEDLLDLRDQNVDLIVVLQEPEEFRHMAPQESWEERRQAMEALGFRVYHSPIEDYHAPSLDQARELVEELYKALCEGQKVVIHCWAGLGRAGTIAACLCVARGHSAESAMQLVRWVRPGAIQSAPQEALIREFHSCFQGRSLD